MLFEIIVTILDEANKVNLIYKSYFAIKRVIDVNINVNLMKY